VILRGTILTTPAIESPVRLGGPTDVQSPGFLRPAIESLFAQTFEDWELVIADDGSSADTRAYLEASRSTRVKVIWLPHTGRPL